VARAEAYLRAKFHLDPSNRLATVHQRYRQTGQDRQIDRQRSDSTGRTVLQTVAQKLHQQEQNKHASLTKNTAIINTNKLNPGSVASYGLETERVHILEGKREEEIEKKVGEKRKKKL